MTPLLDILPPAQRSLWPQLREFPEDFVLYGGTAVALHLGHRESVDFDFFSDLPLDAERKDALRSGVSFLQAATVLQNGSNTFTLLVPVEDSHVKISLFGGLGFGRIAAPEKTTDDVACIASLDDLLAHKLKVIHDRAEGKDYQDIAALLAHGIDLAHGLGARVALFGDNVPVMETVKALTWFNDINEAWRLSDKNKETILKAVKLLPDHIPEVHREAMNLRCTGVDVVRRFRQ